MEKTFVIRPSQEDDDVQRDEIEDYMVDHIISYFTHPDPEGHRKKWKKRKVKKDPLVDYYYV